MSGCCVEGLGSDLAGVACVGGSGAADLSTAVDCDAAGFGSSVGSNPAGFGGEVGSDATDFGGLGDAAFCVSGAASSVGSGSAGLALVPPSLSLQINW